jgi:hypothetical protein
MSEGTDQNAKEQTLACGARSTRVYADAKLESSAKKSAAQNYGKVWDIVPSTLTSGIGGSLQI